MAGKAQQGVVGRIVSRKEFFGRDLPEPIPIDQCRRNLDTAQPAPPGEIPRLVYLILQRLEALEKGLAVLSDRLQCVSAIVAEGGKDGPEPGARTEVGSALLGMVTRIDAAILAVERMRAGLEI